MAHNRIAFFFQYPWLETLPFVREPIVTLARSGYHVDVYMPSGVDYPKPTFSNPGVRVIDFSFDFTAKTFASKLLRLLRKSVANKYTLFFAVPDDSLVLAAITASIMGKPLVAFCDEILGFKGDRRNWMLKWAYGKSRFVVITDLTRITAFEKSIPHIKALNYFELPNAPSSDTRILKAPAKPGCRVLNLGFFNEAFGGHIILDALAYFREGDVQFVVHERSFRQDLGKLGRAQLKLIEKAYPIRFMMDPLPYSRVGEVVNEGHIGLAMYTSEDKNISLCGKGSGKLARYLQHGKPVIVAGENLRWLVETGAAEYAESGLDLFRAVQRIRRDYAKYSANALACYELHFKFERFFAPILRRVQQLAGLGNGAK